MQADASYEEKDLLLQVAGGNEAAYKVLFNQYWDQIYSTAFMFTKSPELSEDLTQDVFARIWVNRAKLATVERFEGFLFIMARNIVFDRLKKEVYVGKHDSFFEDYFSGTVDTPGDNTELKELGDLVEAAIRDLPPQQQRAFRLSRFAGLSHEQIAKEMGISRLSVKSHIVRAIQQLRQSLGEHGRSLPVVIWILLFL